MHKNYFMKIRQCVNINQISLLTHSKESLICCLALATSLAKEVRATESGVAWTYKVLT